MQRAQFVHLVGHSLFKQIVGLLASDHLVIFFSGRVAPKLAQARIFLLLFVCHIRLLEHGLPVWFVPLLLEQEDEDDQGEEGEQAE